MAYVITIMRKSGSILLAKRMSSLFRTIVFCTHFFIRIPNFSLSLNILKFLYFEPKNILESLLNFGDFER